MRHAFVIILDLLLFLTLNCPVMAQENQVNIEKSKKAPAAQEKTITENLIDYSSIKKVIKNDLLESEMLKKNEILKKNKEKEHNKKIEKYNFPDNNEFWTFCSEYWLVKNAPLLKWDFDRPDYDLYNAVKDMFEKLGFYGISFRLLLLKTNTLDHFSLPANKNEYIFLISLPFIRNLELTKMEMAMLILEDFIRSDKSFFTTYLENKNLKEIMGKNFFPKKVDTSIIKNIHKKYDYFIFQKGFSFSQQYETTKRMAELLKGHLLFLKVYKKLIQKIDILVKSNKSYTKYNKIFPSPEMQLKWLDKNSKAL